MSAAALILAATVGIQGASTLSVDMVGNAGVVLSDAETSVVVDLPYEPGAFGYMRYDPAELQPRGTVVAVVTHHHRDHFDPGLFSARAGWRVVGPPSVVTDLPADRVIAGDSVTVGRFSIVVIPTPHTADHRSYRVRWAGLAFYFVGDTEETSLLVDEPPLDLLFITPWLACSLSDAGRWPDAERAILYHRRPDGSDPVCGPAEVLPQGAQFQMQGDPP